MNPADKLIRARRSIYPKFFVPGEIPKESLVQILESANWAPSHRLTEPWRFVVFESPEAKETLAEFLAEAYKMHTAPEAFNTRKYEDKKAKVKASAVVIAIVLRRDPKESVPEWEELAAVSMAVQNLWISATAHGFGGYWSSPKSMIGHPNILSLEKEEKCYGIFYLGRHSMPEIPRKRGDIHEKIRWL